MKKALRTHARDFLAIVGLFVIALVVGVYILSNQRLYLPDWVPIVGSDYVERSFEFSTAQAVTPGQGQEVAIAGIKVGEVSSVDLKDGRAIVTVKIHKKDNVLYRDASALLRPKTGLKDETIQLDPGTPSAGRAPDDWVVPISQTLPDVNFDQILASLDTDTRDYLRLLIAGAGEGLNGRSRDLSNTFRRFEPTSHAVLEITKLLAKRRQNIRRSISNFRALTEALATKDTQLSQLVDSSNAVFQSFARQDQAIRETLQLLPGTLRSAQRNLGKADRLARILGPSLQSLRPGARALGPSLREARPFLRESTPIIADQIRPFTRAALPTAKVLRPAAANLARITPQLTTTFKVLNEFLNELAYNPAGKEEGYLFWLAWANHAGASLFANQDAMGPIRQGVIVVSCSSLLVLPTVTAASPQLGTLTKLLNPVPKEEACANAAGSGTATGTGAG